MKKNHDAGSGHPAEPPHDPATEAEKPDHPIEGKTAGPREKEKTLIIPHGEGSGMGESATEPVEMGEGAQSREGQPRGESPTESLLAEEDLSSHGTDLAGDTEEVLVILPEDEAESGNLPVVETVVVEDQAWEPGPTTTDVLKDVPSDLGPAEASTSLSLEDVPLMKVNPASLAETSTGGSGQAGQGGAENVETAKRAEEEVKVIDEIEDLASDLEEEEPLGEEPARVPAPETEEIAGAGPHASVRRSNRIRLWGLVSSLAALILVGVFFYPDLELLYWRLTGGEAARVATSSGGQAQALGNHGPAARGGEQGSGGADASAAREELRTKIQLAMQIGLRADAGKE